jgi:threonine dehydrogenase-like Zn-dependent dehydrogenase
VVLGDEGSITVVLVGDELQSRYRAGDRYVIQPAVDYAPVNHRDRYLEGVENVRKIAVGYTLAGHLAEYILVTEEVLNAGCLLPVPDPAPPYAYAAIAEPISCVISAQDHHVPLTQEKGSSSRLVSKGLRRDGLTVVVGAGAMGRMHVDLAFAYRPRTIVVADTIDERLKQVRTLFSGRADRLGIQLSAVPVSQLAQVVYSASAG